MYGAFFLDDVLKFSIKWIFVDGTNSLQQLFEKSRSGARYNFKIYDKSDSEIYASPSDTTRLWQFSDSMGWAAGRTRDLSDDDGVWGAAKTGTINGDSPGPSLSSNAGWGLENYSGGDAGADDLYEGSTTGQSGTIKCFIWG